MKAAGFKLLIALSVLLHLGLAAALIWRLPETEPEIRPASLSVSLGASGSSAGAAQPVSDPAPEPVEAQAEPEATPPEREPVEPVRPAAPEPRRVEPAREPVEAREPDTAEPAPSPARPAPAQIQGREGVTGDDAPQQSVDTDGETQMAGFEAIARSHDDQVLARFASAKRYPARARMRGREGAVAVEFTLGPDGRVLDARVLDGSGHRALDRAALDQVRRAEPFPARPPELDWRTRTYRSEVRFALRDSAR